MDPLNVVAALLTALLVWSVGMTNGKVGDRVLKRLKKLFFGR